LRHEFIKKERPIWQRYRLIGVANLYYCQPLIILIAKEFNIQKDTIGNFASGP
jgi:hypothetical protein